MDTGSPVRRPAAPQRSPMRRGRAFTLIELLVVLAVVGIIAGLAFVSYQGQVRKIRRGDARQSLLGIAHQLELCYTARHRYNHPDCQSRRTCYQTAGQTLVPDGTTITAPSCEGRYQISSIDPTGVETLAADGESYSLFAYPQGAQAADDTCANFRYDHSAARSARNAEGQDSTVPCW